MAETEVSKMVAIEEKFGLDMSSYQDLPKSDCNGTNHHNQTNDLDNSYVFVNGADGLPHGAVGDTDVVVGGVPPEPEGSQNEKIGAVCEEAYHLNEGVNGDVELTNGDSNPVNDNTYEQESSHEDGDGFHVSVTDSPVLQTCEIESSPEAEQVSVADSQEVHTEVTKSVVEEDFKQVEDSDGKTESMSEAEVEKTVDQNEGIEGEVEGQQVDIDGITIAEPPPLHVENSEVQGRALELVAEIGEDRESNKNFSDSNNPNSLDDGDGHQSNTSETEALEAQQRAEDIIVDADEHELKSVAVEAEDEAKLAREIAEVAEHEVSTSLEAQQRSEDIVVDADEHELQSVAVEAVDEAKSTTEIAEVAENELSTSLEAQQRSEDFIVDADEHELQHVAVEAVDEAKSTREIAEVAGNEVSTSLEAQQRSEDIVVDADEHELQSVAVMAEGEAKSTRQIAKVADNEVSTSTSLGSESFSINNKDKTLEEEAKTDLSSGVLENQHGDTGASNIVRDMVQETDESKPVSSSSDSHVQTTRGLDLDEKNEDSEVENGAQYLEESQELSVESSDSHAQTNCDMILDENVEDSSVSDVGNGVQYHEESEEPVGSDSHVQTTCGLVLEEKNEDLSVSEVENGVQYHEESQEQPVASSTDSQVRTCDLASEGNNEVSSVAEIENGAQYRGEPQEQPVVRITCDMVLEEKEEESSISVVENGSKDLEESREQSDGCAASHDTMPSEAMPDASVQIQSNPASNAWAPQSGTEVSDVEEVGRVSSLVVDQESQSIKKVIHSHDNEIRCTLDEASSGSEDMVVQEKEIAFEGGDEDHSETDVSSGKSKVGDSSPGILDVKLESGSHVPDLSVRINGGKSDDLAVSCRTDISDGFNVKLVAAVSIESDVDGVVDMVDKLDGAAGNSKENLFVQENENARNSQNEETSAASAGVSTMGTTDGEDKSIKIKTKPFNFLIRTPRFDDDDLREQIRLAKLQIDEKTKLRDAIQLQIQEKRANSQINGIDFEFSKGEGRSARKLVRSKRMEIDSLQSVVNKAKNALSIEDIDSQIQNMDHMIEHETLPLKEEKQLIREIKQLKQLREQLSSNMGSQDEIKQALEQREEIEGRLKILRKELDVLKNRVLKAEATAAEAGKKYDDENRKVKELQAQFRAADEVRQAAYAQWQNLRKEFSKKNKYFFKYKDDAAVASNCAFSRDTEALYRLCTNQVESFMELWNTNPEFRRDYVKFNSRSNIRRFGTLDCRSLGPDEDPPAKPIYADERGNRMVSTPTEVNPAPRIPSAELKQKTPSGNVASDSKSIKKVTEPKSQKVPNGPAINNVQVNGFDASTRSDLTDEVHEEPIRTRDEIEAMRKEEEMRREKAEAELKEQRRLEALEKANEARERKKRQAEKLQQRAEMKTRKEAEQREKEREKRLRKKERKKAGVADANDTTNNCETAPSSESAAENSKEIDVKDAPPAAAKKPQKHWSAAKQSKTKSIPPSLRNRNKKKLQQWMWVGITSFIIVVLFWMGNVGVFSNVALKRRPPVY